MGMSIGLGLLLGGAGAGGGAIAPSGILDQWAPRFLAAQADGSGIASLVSQTGSGNDFLQATGANQPLYKVNSANGCPAARADGVNVWMQNSSSMALTGNFGFFAAIKFNGDPSRAGAVVYPTLVSQDEPTTDSKGWLCGFYNASPRFGLTIPATAFVGYSYPAILDSNVHIVDFSIDGSGNWVAGMDGYEFQGNHAIPTATAQPWLLFSDGQGNGRCKIDLLELVRYPFATLATRKAIRSYLATLYGASLYQQQVWYSFNGGTEALTAYVSPDGSTWEWVQGVSYTPAGGVTVRDPSPFVVNGKFHMAHTSGYPTGGLNGAFSKCTAWAEASSTDGLHWTTDEEVDCSAITGTGTLARTWAPDEMVDAGNAIHVFVGLSTDGMVSNGVLCEQHPTTSDPGAAWSAPAATGLPSGTFDPCVRWTGTQYVAFYRYLSHNFLAWATASSLSGPWTEQNNGSTNWMGSALTVQEGPELYQLSNGHVRVYYDDGTGNSNIHYMDATDWTFTSLGSEVSMVGNTYTGVSVPAIRHGGLLQAPLPPPN